MLFRYWLYYSKQGKAAFLSHLDTIRVFERALRRSSLDIAFTSGFNPRIRFSAPSALPVGLSVRNEGLAVSMKTEYSIEEVAGAVDAQLPEGFRIERVERESADAGRERCAGGTHEEIVFEIRHGGPREKALRAVESWRDRERIEVLRVRDGRANVIDLKPHVGEVSVGAEEIVVSIRPVDGVYPRMSDLLKSLHAIAGDEGMLEIHEITRL
jgi:radical SAM-linked protein